MLLAVLPSPWALLGGVLAGFVYACAGWVNCYWGGSLSAFAGASYEFVALAQESAKKGITVNCIAPGYVDTEMVQAVPKDVLEKSILPLIPVNRLGEPEEIARTVVFQVRSATKKSNHAGTKSRPSAMAGGAGCW